MTYGSNKAHRPAAWHPWRNSGISDPKVLPPERTCKKCEQTKPIAEFRRLGDKPDHIRAHDCNACRAAYLANYYLIRKERIAERKRVYEQTARAVVLKRRRNARYTREAAIAAGKDVPDPAPQRWVGTVRAGIELGVCDDRVRDWCRKGELLARKIWRKGGLSWAIDPASVEAMKKERGLA